jgi:hypothetical protein
MYMGSYLFIGFLFSLIFLFSYHKIVDRALGTVIFLILVYAVGFYDTKISMTHYGGAITMLLGVFTGMWILIILILSGLI